MTPVGYMTIGIYDDNLLLFSALSTEPDGPVSKRVQQSNRRGRGAIS